MQLTLLGDRGQSVQANSELNGLSRARRVELAGANVLVAEDNPVNLSVAQFHLEDLGCLPVCAVNGAEAVACARSQHFDFILMDCQMPVMDGFAALAAIRALGPANANGATIVLAVTAADDLQSRQNCKTAGFDGFLAKPFSAAQLRAALLGSGDASAVMATQMEPAADAVLDPAVFKSFVDDFGLDTAPSLLQSYMKLLSESLTRFDRCVAAHDVADLQALGHKLAGGSGTVGAQKLGKLAKSIDARGKKKQLAFDAEALALRADIEATQAFLAPLVQASALQAFVSKA